MQIAVTGKQEKVWFNIAGDYGNIEYAIMKTNTVYSGKWAGMFGNNGYLKVKYLGRS